jgi:putative colanic acid biosysnthesis UDP-glucose lipid carrier transferase
VKLNNPSRLETGEAGRDGGTIADERRHSSEIVTGSRLRAVAGHLHPRPEIRKEPGLEGFGSPDELTHVLASGRTLKIPLAAASTTPSAATNEYTGLDLVCRAVDGAVIIATLVAAVIAHYGYFPDPYFFVALLVPLIKPSHGRRAMAPAPLVVRDALFEWSAVGLLLLALGYATTLLQVFSATVLLYWFVTGAIALVVARLGVRALAPRFVALERARTRVLIAGANPVGVRLAQALRADPLLGASVVGFVDDRSRPRCDVNAERVLGALSEIDALVHRHRVARIYIALPMSSQPRILALLEQLRDTTASIYFVPDIFIADLIQARVDRVGGLPVVGVCETPYSGVNAFVNRASDLAVASLVLALIWPVMVAIAIGVKLSSPGPVIFSQRRYGLDGTEISVYKFRTMTVCEDGASIVQAMRNDARVTRFGAFLRRYSLDELPQFINVLQGRMSVVGPRPHAVAHNELYRKVIKGYMVRHKVKPGITGWAQVRGFRGETDTIDKMKGRIDCDLEYLRKWSLELDLRIILRTILIVFRDRNAF